MEIHGLNFQGDKLFRCAYKTERYEIHMHLHQFAEVVYVRRGSIDLFLMDHTERIGDGQIAVIAPYQNHGYNAKAKADFWLAVFSTTLIRDLFPETESLAEREVSVFTPSPSLIQYLEGHPIDTREVLVGYDPTSFRRMKTVLTGIYEEYLKSAIHIKKDPSNTILAPLTQYLARHHGALVSLKSAAKAIGYSESHVSHCLSGYHMNFCELVNAFRMDAAKELLLFSDKRIIDIALESGYSCERTFNYTFRAAMGMTPTAYRKNHKRENLEGDSLVRYELPAENET